MKSLAALLFLLLGAADGLSTPRNPPTPSASDFREATRRGLSRALRTDPVNGYQLPAAVALEAEQAVIAQLEASGAFQTAADDAAAGGGEGLAAAAETAFSGILGDGILADTLSKAGPGVAAPALRAAAESAATASASLTDDADPREASAHNERLVLRSRAETHPMDDHGTCVVDERPHDSSRRPLDRASR